MEGEAQTPNRDQDHNKLFAWKIARRESISHPRDDDKTDAPENIHDAGVFERQANEP